MSNRTIVLGLAALWLAPPVLGQSQPLQVHGFASAGLVVSEGNNVNGDSKHDGGSTEFRELGVNFSYRPVGSLMFAAQMAAVEAGNAIDEDMELEYGLADWTPLSGARGRFGLRAGKLKLPIGFYNESRDAVFTRPGILLPESVYLENSGARAFGYFSAEGGGIYGDWFLDRLALYGELQVARPQPLDDNAEIAILRTAASGRFEVDRGVIGRVAGDFDGGRFRAALSFLTTELAYANPNPVPGPANPFPTEGDFEFDQLVLSLQYNAARWSVTSEIVARHIELEDLNAFTPLIGPVTQDPGGWYLQGSYRLTPKWQWLLRHDQQIRDMDDRHGYDQAASQGLPRHYFFARDWTAGTRYDVNPNVSLWAEFHYVDGAGWVNPLDNADFGAGGADRYWNLFTVMAALRF